MSYTEPIAESMLNTGDASALPWAEATRRLAAGSTFWLATTRPDGQPQVRPILTVWVDDALHFVASATSRKAKNLALNAHCAITTSGSDMDLVVEGEAAMVREEPTLRRVAEAYATKYDWHPTVRDGAFHDTEGAPTAGPPPYDVYTVNPAVAYGFGTTDETGNRTTRWRF